MLQDVTIIRLLKKLSELMAIQTAFLKRVPFGMALLLKALFNFI